MKRKKMISILAVIMAVVMILSLLVSITGLRAYAVSQSQIEELRKKRSELAQLVEEAQERLEGLEEQQANVLEQQAALEVQNEAAKAALETVAQEIAYYNDLIEEKALELEAALNAEQVQLERYRRRVRAMEENGSYNVLALILQSESFPQLLAALDDISAIMDSDVELEHRYQEARQEVERVKAEYEEVRADCEAQQEALEAEKALIEAKIAEAEEKLAALADEIEEAMALYEEQLAAEEAASQEIAAMIAQYEAEQRAAAAAAAAAAQAAGGGGSGDNAGTSGGGSTGGGYTGGASSTGSFIWPVPCSTRITGRYGETRPGHFHAGIDIDGYGNDGGAIVAAASGTVIFSGSGSAYGNYVIIDHGNGYQTVYAHNSSNAVSSGAYVSAGQTIAALGATGNASGTHCHFEVRLNGSTVDPTQFFSGYSYWP